MKNLALTGTIIVTSILLAACDPQQPNKKPARGPEPTSANPADNKPKPPKTEKKKVEAGVEVSDPTPVVETTKPDTNKPAAPAPNPEYGKKAEGKAGFIESPHAPGKLIDVRGLPPGTEIECPYTRKPLLVP